MVFVCIYIYIYIYISVALRSNSGSWPPLSGSPNHTHWTDHTRSDSPERVISPILRPLPGKTHHSQETDIHTPEGIRTHSPSKRTDQTHALERTATRIGFICLLVCVCVCVCVCVYIYIYICVCVHVYIKCFGRLYMRNNGYDLPIVLSLYALRRSNTRKLEIVNRDINACRTSDKLNARTCRGSLFYLSSRREIPMKNSLT
jgi:hypothetical protein